MLTIVLSQLAGGRLVAVSELWFMVQGCDAQQVLATPDAVAFEHDAGESGASWSGRVGFEREVPVFQSARNSVAISEWSDALRSRGCSLSGFEVSQRLSFSWLYLAMGSILASLLLFAMFGRRLGDPPAASSSRSLILRSALCGVSGVVLAIVFSSVLITLFPEVAELDYFGGLGLSAPLLFGLVAVAIPVTEELLFRRMALQIWIDARLTWLGTGLVSAWFAGIHVFMLTGLPWVISLAGCLFLLSIAASLAYRASGWAGASLLHCAYNATLVAPLLLAA